MAEVFTLGISGIVTCRDEKTGRQLWQREFSKQFAKTSPLYGASMSPAVAGGKCIVHVGGHDQGALVALDVATGETLWSWDDDGPGYASPVLVTLDEVPQVVTQSQKACIGVDLADGKLLWRIPFQTEYDQNSVTPIEHEGSLIFSGINQGVDRYRVELSDDEWEIDKMWGEKSVSFYMSSPVADARSLVWLFPSSQGRVLRTRPDDREDSVDQRRTPGRKRLVAANRRRHMGPDQLRRADRFQGGRSAIRAPGPL